MDAPMPLEDSRFREPAKLKFKKKPKTEGKTQEEMTQPAGDWYLGSNTMCPNTLHPLTLRLLKSALHLLTNLSRMSTLLCPLIRCPYDIRSSLSPEEQTKHHTLLSNFSWFLKMRGERFNLELNKGVQLSMIFDVDIVGPIT